MQQVQQNAHVLTDAWTAEPRDDRRGASKPELGPVRTAFCMRASIRTQSHASRVPAAQAGRARHLREGTVEKKQETHLRGTSKCIPVRWRDAMRKSIRGAVLATPKTRPS